MPTLTAFENLQSQLQGSYPTVGTAAAEPIAVHSNPASITITIASGKRGE
jgi:hypothetical protein